MKAHSLLSVLLAAVIGGAASADVRLPEYGQSAYISNKVDQIAASVDNITVVTNKAVVDVEYDGVDSAVCILDVYVNAVGDYELPSSSSERAELLSNAYIRVSIPGFANPVSAALSSLEACHKRFLVPASDGETVTGYVSLKLGASPTCGYGAAKVPVSLVAGEKRTIRLNTSPLDGEIVEVCRIQPWNSTAAGAGPSFLGTRITNANGTKFHIGGYDPDDNYIDQSLTSVTIYDVARDGDVAGAVTTNVISSGGSENALSIEERLGLTNMTTASVSFISGSYTNADNLFTRYTPLWCKTTLEDVPILAFSDSEGTTVSATNMTKCCVKWMSTVQADEDYHLHPLFVRVERNGDTYTETPLKYGFIARYPIANTTLNINGTSVYIGTSRADNSHEVGLTRDGFLTRCKNNNAADCLIEVDGEDPVFIAANSDSRLCSMAGLSEYSFIQWLSYLYFGNNAQASLYGIAESSGGTDEYNGRCAYIIDAGIWTGGENTQSASKQMIFCGTEGAWGAPGWMIPDVSAIHSRITTTDSTGAYTDTTLYRWAYCRDRNDFAPAGNDLASMDGYRLVAFDSRTGSAYWTRAGYDPAALVRDCFFPSADFAQSNISIGSADYTWNGAAPSALSTYSASSTYTVGSYAVYDSFVYCCTNAVTTAEAFNADNWELQVNQTIERANWFMVASGYYRSFGLHLGPFCWSADYGLSASIGNNWRGRISLQPLILP